MHMHAYIHASLWSVRLDFVGHVSLLCMHALMHVCMPVYMYMYACTCVYLNEETLYRTLIDIPPLGELVCLHACKNTNVGVYKHINHLLKV
jgi:hypothetical protein